MFLPRDALLLLLLAALPRNFVNGAGTSKRQIPQIHYGYPLDAAGLPEEGTFTKLPYVQESAATKTASLESAYAEETESMRVYTQETPPAATTLLTVHRGDPLKAPSSTTAPRPPPQSQWSPAPGEGSINWIE